jgi:hypothetical protein
LLIATSKRQAQIDFGYVRGKIRNSEVLEAMVESETKETITLTNHIAISVYPCSEVAPRGLSVPCGGLDEVGHMKHEGVSIDKEIVDSIRPALVQFANSKLIKVTTPSSKMGIVWQDHRDHYGKYSEVLFFQAPSHKMNPQIPEHFVVGELRKDRAFAATEYLAQFRDDLGDYIDPEDLDAVICKGRRELPYVSKMPLFAFCDMSGGKRDDAALSITGREESGQIIQLCLRVKRAPFNPAACIKEFAETLRNYHLSQVTGDKYSAGFVEESFQSNGVFYQPTELNKSQIYLEFLPLIMQQRVTLLDIKDQTIQIRQLERRAGRNQDVIDHPRGLKDDIANTCAGACVLAAKTDSWRLPPPSFGVVEFAENEKERMDRESVEWLTGQKRKHKDEDEDFCAEDWDVDAMSQSQIKKELEAMEDEEE